jgi:hypothetical protein
MRQRKSIRLGHSQSPAAQRGGNNVTHRLHLAPAHDGSDRLRWLLSSSTDGVRSTEYLLGLLEVEVFDTKWRLPPYTENNKLETIFLFLVYSWTNNNPGI